MALSMDMWRLADELSVVNAAILITGNNPSTTHSVTDLDVDMTYREQTTNGHAGFDAAFNALRGAILAGKLRATVLFSIDVDPSELKAVVQFGRKIEEIGGRPMSQHAQAVTLRREPDWKQTMVEVEELRRWLQLHNFYPTFFFPATEANTEGRGYMAPGDSRYSPKLACAVRAWEALADLPRSKSVKNAIRNWVAENGASYGIGSEGNVPRDACDQIAKVVNWNPKGGAPKTGGQVSRIATQVRKGSPDFARENQKMQPSFGEDDDAPPGL